MVGSLDPADERSIELRVAGPAALLISKVRKIADRVASNRLSDKDALDVVRLLRGVETPDLAKRCVHVLSDDLCRATAEEGLDLLKQQFVNPDGIGGEMIERTVSGLADPTELKASARLLSEDLLNALG